jgi:hypothetical protein
MGLTPRSIGRLPTRDPDVVEIVLRVVAPGQWSPHWERDPIVGWRGRRSAVGIVRTAACSTEYRHNADGFRDGERRVERAGAETGVLCVGDSFTRGWGVPFDAVYTRELERLLERGGRSVEVVSQAVGGYNAVQSLLLLRDEGFACDPDIVIHQATENDLPANGRRSPTGGPWEHPYAELRGGRLVIAGTPIQPLSPIGWIKYQLPRHSRLACVVRLSVARLRARLARPPERAPGGGPMRDEPSSDDAFRLFAELVRMMDRECAARGARFILIADLPLGPERASYWRATSGGVEAHFVREHLLRRERERRASRRSFPATATGLRPATPG